MSCFTNPHHIDHTFHVNLKSEMMNQSTDQPSTYLTYFDTRSLDRDRESRCGSTPSSKSSMSSKSSSPMTPSSCDRDKSTFNQLNSDRLIGSWQQPETGSLKARSRTISQRQTSTYSCTSTRPGTPIVPAQQQISKRSTLPSSFKLSAITEPVKIQRRQTTLRAAGASICEERVEAHAEDDW